MNDIVQCCGTCRNSCGSGDNLYCSENLQNVTPCESCMMYESKKDETEDQLNDY